MKRALLALLLLIGGCAPKGDAWTLYIDPAFSDAEKAEWRASALRWEAAVPAEFSFRDGVCSGIHNGVICTHVSDAAGVRAHLHDQDPSGIQAVTDSRSFINGADIYVDETAMIANTADAPKDLPWSYAHELGHAMGLRHGDPDNEGTPSTLMYYIYQGSSAGEVTCLDAIRWRVIRGLAPHCE